MLKFTSGQSRLFRPALLTATLWLFATVAVSQPCRIEVVEEDSGWPVPLVELRTTHNLSYWSDNAGLIACDAPELMGRRTWFNVKSHGYEVKKDGFGMQGVRLTPEPGKTLQVKVRRTIVAKRLGRLTGAGIFSESKKLGEMLDWEETGCFGCDSVQNAVVGGRLFWSWGDTILPHYPLGVFHMTAAFTDLQPLARFEPPLALKYEYFRNPETGLPREVCKMPGSGPTWAHGFTTLPDAEGQEKLVAHYIKVRGFLEAYESGVCVWNPKTENFDQVRVIWTKSDETPKPPPSPTGHPVFHTDRDGKRWAYYGDPFPVFRCPATYEDWLNPETWEALEPQEKLISGGDGKYIVPHGGSIAWNEYRQRWVTVFMQKFGSPSMLGELWYAEAPEPTGPWGVAVKVVSHDNYTFYNPRLHPEMTPSDSPILLFEGTYTQQFSDKPQVTPLYDYNQILYRLDLDDPALTPAQEL